ncbi:MAG: hypothetical protein P3X23_011330 [Thermosynechococcus sp. Uc]|uniref:hypothetical protein n=1 Tax=Thermosynechococcus sp. Uc TaxID=3034853 RepID=UPI00259D3A3D|nr:hypothetical protein [Thermosynechococcus sp. Uc]MDM7327685.1 hypothetical protein [Thermosynechococcus sp. Uc]
MSHSNLISKHLRPHRANQGQIHIDYLKIPENYPEDLCSTSPHLIHEYLKQYKTNLTPLIIRPVTTLEGDTEYEVVFGKEVVEFARELGINQLWASRIELEDKEIPAFQERLKSILQTSSKDGNSYAQKSERDNLVNEDSQLVVKLLNELQKSLNEQIQSIVGQLQKINWELNELKRNLSELQQPVTKSQQRVAINTYKNAENLTKRVPGLILEEAQVITQQNQQCKKFKSVDELKKIAPSGRWDEVSLLF